jgi:hypothetical protein
MNYNDKKRLEKVSTQELKERKAQILRSLPSMDHVIRGSLITRLIKCGKPNCHCATGEGHISLYLSSFYHGHTGMDYVPSAWESWMREGIENYGVIKDLLLELTELNLELFSRREKS